MTTTFTAEEVRSIMLTLTLCADDRMQPAAREASKMLEAFAELLEKVAAFKKAFNSHAWYGEEEQI